MTYSRTFAESGVLNDQLYVAGGYDYDNFSHNFTVLEAYDPATDSWSTKAPMLIPVGEMAGEVVDNKLYLIGGWVYSDSNNSTNVVQIYDPTTDSWSMGAPMPTARGLAASAVINGKIYVAGGMASVPTVFTALEIYDPATDTWSTGTPLPTCCEAGRGAAIDGKFYVIGGSDLYWSQHSIGAVQVYDSVTEVWTTGASMPTPRSDFASGVIDGKFYAFGGVNSPSPGAATIEEVMEVYDATTDTWSTDASMLAPLRRCHTAEVIQGRLYSAGGIDNWTALSTLATLDVFTPAQNHAPVAGDDTYALDEDSTLSIVADGVLGNDSDADSDPLTAALVAGPAHGALMLNADGSFSYTPEENFHGADAFTYMANDGTADSNVATVAITVNPMNDAPVVGDFSVTTTMLSRTIPVLDHAADVDGDALSVVSVTQGANGTVSINGDGTVTYKLTRFFSGTDSFAYTVSDGNGGTATATVTVNVQVPAEDGIALMCSQVAHLNLWWPQKALLLNELRLADWWLDRGRPRMAVVQLRVFALHVQILENIRWLDAASADLLTDEVREVIKVLL